MHFISKRVVILGVVASLGFAGTAQAQQIETDDTGVVLTGGGITMAEPAFSNFASTPLTGSIQTPVTEIADWSVNDARGTGAGYTVSMQAGPVKDDLDTPGDATDDVTMDGAVLSVVAPIPSAAEGNNSPAPAATGGNITAGQLIVDAEATEGLGTWTYAQDANDLTLKIPANARLGDYASTITTTLTAVGAV